MIIWSGFGFLPVAFILLFGLGFSAGSNGPISDSAMAYTCFGTGLASAAVGWWLLKQPGRVMIDKATGKEVVFRRRHTLFFIPLFYWGPIFFAMGLYEVVQVMTKH